VKNRLTRVSGIQGERHEPICYIWNSNAHGFSNVRTDKITSTDGTPRKQFVVIALDSVEKAQATAAPVGSGCDPHEDDQVTRVSKCATDCRTPRRNNTMNRTAVLLFGLALLGTYSTASFAQSGAPTYQADPDVYKIIFEDQNLRVIAATWKAGTTDKPHTHPLPSVIYFLTDCTQKLHAADGSVRDVSTKAGSSNGVPIIAQPHTAENVGPECRTIFVERK
jgi:hypothetical protein